MVKPGPVVSAEPSPSDPSTRAESDRAAPLTGWETLAFWGAFGLLAGLAEVVMLGVTKFGLGKILWLGPHVLWMAPLTSLVTFLALGVPFALSRQVLGWVPSLRTQTFLAAAIGATGAVSILPGLHYLAVLVLGTGIAVQTTRLLARREAYRGMGRRILPLSMGTVVLLALAVIGLERLAVRRFGPVGEAPQGAPNVLLITVDTERAASLSLYGYAKPTTPELDAFAASGATFDLAFSTATWTLNGHATLLTGRYPHELSSDWEVPLDDTFTTLGEYLAENGYATAGFVANLFYCQREFGLRRGFSHFEDFKINLQEFVLSTALGRRLGHSGTIRRFVGFYDFLARKDAESLTDDFLDWARRNDGERPFFAWLNYFDTHELYLPPSPYQERFAEGGDAWDYSQVIHRIRGYDLDAWRRMRSKAAEEGARPAYEGAVAYSDAHMGRMFSELADMGQLDNTIVVVTSDHGELFGEHGLDHHSNSLYTQVLHVPLVIRFPERVPAGFRVSKPVTLRDVPATIASLVGLPATEVPIPGEPLDRFWDPSREFQGASPVLGRLIPNRQGGRPRGRWLSVVVDDRYHYMIRPNGTEEVYDLWTDLAETENLVDREDVSSMLPTFREAVAAAWSEEDDVVLQRLDPSRR